MASPQLDDGYTSLVNAIWDALARIRIPGEAHQVLTCIIRKTYGYHKKEDQIALSQLSEATGLSKVHVIQAIEKLVIMNMIIVTEKGNDIAKTYRFIKDFEKWKPLPKKVTLPNSVIPLPKKVMTVTEKGNASLPNSGTTKETTTKETTTKENTPLPPKGESHDLFLAPELNEVIPYLNTRTGRHLKEDARAFAKRINARHREGATAELMKKVIDWKVWAWRDRYRNRTTGEIEIPEGTLDMRERLTPLTLFNEDKFWVYVDEALSHETERILQERKKQEYENSGVRNDALHYKAREEAHTESSAMIAKAREKYGNGWWKHLNEFMQDPSPEEMFEEIPPK